MGSSSSNEAGLRGPTSLRAQNPEVYYSDDAIVTADDATIAELKRIAAGNPRLRSRLCTKLCSQLCSMLCSQLGSQLCS